MYYKKIYAALLSISIFALVSCASYERVPKNESVQIIEAPILDNSSENIIQEGKINLIKYKDEPQSNNKDIYVRRKNTLFWPFRVITAINNSKDNLLINYENQENKVIITYDCNYLKTSDDDYKACINQIRIKNLSKEKYKFKTMGYYRPFCFLPFTGFIYNGYNSKDLPVELATFNLDNTQYKVLITKIKIQLPAYVNKYYTKEDVIETQLSSLKSLLKLDDQVFVIADENDNMYAAFNHDSYEIYSIAKENTDDFVLLIGVYTGIIDLLLHN